MGIPDPNREPPSRLFADIRYHLTDGFSPRDSDPWMPRFLEDNDDGTEMFVIMVHLLSVNRELAVAVAHDQSTGEVTVSFDYRLDGEVDRSLPSGLLVNPTDWMVLDVARVFVQHSNFPAR